MLILTPAAELALHGATVRIIDPAPAATDTSKTMRIWPRRPELSDRAGCAEAVIVTG